MGVWHRGDDLSLLGADCWLGHILSTLDSVYCQLGFYAVWKSMEKYEIRFPGVDKYGNKKTEKYLYFQTIASTLFPKI